MLVPIKFIAGTFIVLVIIFICSFFLAVPKNSANEGAQTSSHLIFPGKSVFENYCSNCHGILGDGHGPFIVNLTKLPPDFNNPNSHFKNGFSYIGLSKTLNEGIAGTQMPAFNYLPAETKKDLIEYLLHIRNEKKL